MLFLFAKVWIS